MLMRSFSGFPWATARDAKASSRIEMQAEIAFFTCDFNYRAAYRLSSDRFARADAPDRLVAKALKAGADLDRIGRRCAHRLDFFIQQGDFGENALADLLQRRALSPDLAAFHDGLEQRFAAVDRLVCERDDVLRNPGTVAKAVNL